MKLPARSSVTTHSCGGSLLVYLGTHSKSAGTCTETWKGVRILTSELNEAFIKVKHV